MPDIFIDAWPNIVGGQQVLGSLYAWMGQWMQMFKDWYFHGTYGHGLPVDKSQTSVTVLSRRGVSTNFNDVKIPHRWWSSLFSCCAFAIAWKWDHWRQLLYCLDINPQQCVSYWVMMVVDMANIRCKLRYIYIRSRCLTWCGVYLLVFVKSEYIRSLWSVITWNFRPSTICLKCLIARWMTSSSWSKVRFQRLKLLAKIWDWLPRMINKLLQHSAHSYIWSIRHNIQKGVEFRVE